MIGKNISERGPECILANWATASAADDGIYVLLKEVLDNSVDEFMMGNGRKIDVRVSDELVSVRDYGRGIPLGKLMDVTSRMNTGAKYDSKVFKKSVGLNGVGIKAVNALSMNFSIKSIRDGRVKRIDFSKGELVKEHMEIATEEANGTAVAFTPDSEIFKNFHYIEEFIVPLLKNYTFLNAGLIICFNGEKYLSRNGLYDLLEENVDQDPRISDYPSERGGY